MGVGSPTEGPPLPMVLPPVAATAPNEQLGIPPLLATEAEGRQPQLATHRFLFLYLCLLLERPGVWGKDC